MKTFFRFAITALLLGCIQSALACQRLDLYDEKNCQIVKRILAGEIVSFGPDMSARDDIVQVCDKIFKGFMDESALSSEIRERFFVTKDGFDCFKPLASNGEKQVRRPSEQRELGSKKGAPKKLYGTTTVRDSGRRRR